MKKSLLWMLTLVLLLGTPGLVLTGCDRREGPFEDTGEQLDEGLEEMGDRIEDATDR